jgi:hypothetical protein
MSKSEKSNYEKRLEYQATVTKQPNKEIIAAWYDVEPRAMRDRYILYGVGVKNRVLTERDLGEIFYKCGTPIKIPVELHEWATELAAAYCRLVPFTAV